MHQTKARTVFRPVIAPPHLEFLAPPENQLQFYLSLFLFPIAISASLFPLSSPPHCFLVLFLCLFPLFCRLLLPPPSPHLHVSIPALTSILPDLRLYLYCTCISHLPFNLYFTFALLSCFHLSLALSSRPFPHSYEDIFLSPVYLFARFSFFTPLSSSFKFATSLSSVLPFTAPLMFYSSIPPTVPIQAGVITGAIIGVVLGLLVLIVVIYYLMRFLVARRVFSLSVRSVTAALCQTGL